MILLVGGTGPLGSTAANLLRKRGVAVRVLSRGLAPHPGTLDTDVELVRGDVRDPASLRTPMEGVDLIVSAIQGFAGPGGVTPKSVDQDGNIHLIEVAERVGADIVMISVIGASPESHMELMRARCSVAGTIPSLGSALLTWRRWWNARSSRSHCADEFLRSAGPNR